MRCTLARMGMNLTKFKQESARMRAGKGRQGRYSTESRTWAVRQAQQEMAGGCSVIAVASDLGVGDMTLCGWLFVAQQQSPTLSEVVVVQEPKGSSAGLTVTTASGHTVGGLDMQTAVELLRALG